MKHLILGTAGHIDHGKTALIRALTGTDCDTHPEEKRRGITINLGFAHLDFPDGLGIGIIDVPGHHDFVHTMVGGASSIDMGLLVVAADEGVMPQTKEHLQIMQVLGVHSGLIALTKIDVADQAQRAAAEIQVREAVSGSFLQNAPIMPVSSLSCEGIEALKDCIRRVAGNAAAKPPGATFRLYIDRIFEAKGFGQVVNGSVLSGRLRVGDSVFLLPGKNASFRVRGLQRHGLAVDEVQAGDRAALNLAGLRRADVRRGMLLSGEELEPVDLLDAQLELFREAPELKLRSQCIFYLGTHECQTKVHLLDRDSLSGGTLGLAQLHLQKAGVFYYGDRFVLRDSSGACTIGGGRIIDALPLHHRRRPPELVARLQKIAAGGKAEAFAAEIRKRPGAISGGHLARVFNLPPAELLEEYAASLPQDIVCRKDGRRLLFITKDQDESLRARMLEILNDFHRQNPLEAGGCSAQELLGLLALPPGGDNRAYLELLLDELRSQGLLKSLGAAWGLAAHEAAAEAGLEREIKFVGDYLKSCGMQVPLMAELIGAARAQGIDEKLVRQVLRYLVGKKQAYSVDDTCLHAELVDSSRIKLLEALHSSPQGVTLAQFRDLIGGNRKVCLSLCNIFDAEGIVLRKGDVRVLTEKGRRVPTV